MMEIKINLTPEEETLANQLIQQFGYKSLEDYAYLVVQMDLKNFKHLKEMEMMRASKVKQVSVE